MIFFSEVACQASFGLLMIEGWHGNFQRQRHHLGRPHHTVGEISRSLCNMFGLQVKWVNEAVASRKTRYFFLPKNGYGETMYMTPRYPTVQGSAYKGHLQQQLHQSAGGLGPPCSSAFQRNGRKTEILRWSLPPTDNFKKVEIDLVGFPGFFLLTHFVIPGINKNNCYRRHISLLNCSQKTSIWYEIYV